MKIKNSCKLLSVTISILLMLSFSVDVFASEIKNITLLGDSISEGYGLTENDKNYGVWLGEYYDAEVENFAKFGKETTDLMDSLENDTSISDSVKQADLICITIGANDVLNIFFDDLVNIGKSYTSSSGEFNISSEAVQGLILSFSSELGPAAAKAGQNIGKIREKIHEMNPDANIIFQTVYNPFETDNESIRSLASTLYTFTAIYLSAINNSVKNCENNEFADIQHKFKSNCTMFTNIDKLDIHPNPLGHLIIAEEIVQKLKISGNGDIFKNGLKTLNVPDIDKFPNELKDEITMLSNGEFRKEEEINSVMEIMNESTEQSETQEKTENTEKEKSNAKESDNTKNYINIIIFLAVTIFLIVSASIILIKINRSRI